MTIRTGDDYRESLRKLAPRIFVQGELVEDVTTHPLLEPHVNAAALTYDLALEPEYEELMTAISHITDEPISRFTHIHQSAEDLVKKVKMLRLLGQKTGTCWQRCVGFDALNAVYSTTYEVDAALGTTYHLRLREYLRMIQTENLMVVGAMTDTKGDRSLPPSAQPDPDAYVHVAERRDDGVVLRGAKVHMTGAVNSHEILVMPTVALKEGEGAYAISCAVPVDAPGITMVFGRQTNDSRRLEPSCVDSGNERYGIVGGEAIIVFEDVFVPEDRVFLDGEVDFSGMMVERFAALHRQNYGGCKTGVAEVLTGAVAALAEYHGVAKASHVRDKLTEMVFLSQSLYAGSLACSWESSPLPCGAYYVDPLLASVTKHAVTRSYYEICRLAQDIAGGVIATLPSQQDFTHPELQGLLEKYYSGREGVRAEDRVRLARLIENMTSSIATVECMHGAGSPQAQRVMMLRQAGLDKKARMALDLAGITDPYDR